MRQRRIEELVEGEGARVVGRIAPIDAVTLKAPSGTACLYWDVRFSMEAKPLEREARPFWVQDESGRVLVRPEEMEVYVSGRPTEKLIEVATAEIEAVETEIRRVKDLQREKSKPEYLRRRRELAKVATLLCRVRAHARGHVHGKGTLESQKRWIVANQHLAHEGFGLATLRSAGELIESHLAVGEEVVIEASFRREPMPADLGGIGYRDRQSCLVATELGGRRPLIVAQRLLEEALRRREPGQWQAASPDGLDLSALGDLRVAARRATEPDAPQRRSWLPWWAPLALGLVIGLVLFLLLNGGR